MRHVTVTQNRTKILEKSFPEFEGSDEELKTHVREYLEKEEIINLAIETVITVQIKSI